jgi:hypothetical protein
VKQDPPTSGLGTRQLRLLRRSRAFLRSAARRGVDVAVSPECYLNGWARVPGRARVHALAQQRWGAFGLAVARLREAALVAGHSGYEVVAGTGAPGQFDRMVVSWSRGVDFAPDGAFRDRLFRTGSRENPSTLWFLIPVDDAVQHVLDPNIVLFRRRPGARRRDFSFLLRSAAAIPARASRPDGTAPVLSATVSFADQLPRAVIATADAARIRSIVMPYEAQPFQHTIFRAAKQQGRTVRTIGYLHSALPPVPTDLIHRPGAPELLLVHGPGQIDILSRHLGWPASSLRAIPSLRYRTADAALGGFVLLPYHFDDPDVIEAAYREFLRSCAPAALPRLTVRNHPIMVRSRAHIELGRKLEAIMCEHADRFSPSPATTSVFIGATAAILEALEQGIVAIHISSRPFLESHSAEIWRDLSVERLGEYVFRYRLPVRGTYIQFGSERLSLDSCFEPTIGGDLAESAYACPPTSR